MGREDDRCKIQDNSVQLYLHLKELDVDPRIARVVETGVQMAEIYHLQEDHQNVYCSSTIAPGFTMSYAMNCFKIFTKISPEKAFLESIFIH